MNRTLVAVVALTLVTSAFASPKYSLSIEDLSKTKTFFGLDAFFEYGSVPNIENVKVAVLDSGFKGLDQIHRYLPYGSALVAAFPGVSTIPLDEEESHGTLVAQIIGGLSGAAPRAVNANGPENFAEALKLVLHGDPNVPKAERWIADIIVHAANWETFGNFRGDGFIDELVEEAVVDEGKIFINAAGNTHLMVYNGPLFFRKENTRFATFRNGTYFLNLTNRVDENQLTITLSWNSFSPGNPPVGTQKDLDIHLYEEGNEKKPLACSSQNRTQVVQDPKAENQETLHPRETITCRIRALKNKKYRISVEKKAGEFTDRDRIRITLRTDKQAFPQDGKMLEPIVFHDATDDGELGVPADGKGLTVSAMGPYSSRGPTLDGRGKPELVMEKSDVKFTNKEGYEGTTVAAAYMGAIAAILKATEPGLKQEHLLAFRKMFPNKYYEAQGWKFGYGMSDMPNELYRELLKTFVIDEFAQAKEKTVPLTVGVKNFSKLKAYPTVTEEQLKNPDDYSFYLYLYYTPTTVEKEELVRGPSKTKRVLVEKARVDLQSKVVAYTWALNAFGQLQLVPLKQWYTVSYPNRYEDREVPGDLKWVTKTVPGYPKPGVGLLVMDKNSKKTPWEKQGGLPQHFFRLVPLDPPKVFGKAKVVDGTENDPRVWETPANPDALREKLRTL